MDIEQNLQAIKKILFVFVFVLIIFLLRELSTLLIPLFLALFLTMMFLPLVTFLQKLKTPNFLVFPIVTIITLGVLFLIYQIINETVSSILVNQDYLIDRFRIKVNSILDWINLNFKTDLSISKDLFDLDNYLDKDKLGNTAKNLASFLGSFSGSFFMFFLYYIFLLVGITNYNQYIHYVQGNEGTGLISDIERIQKSILSYMLIKTLISLSTGIAVAITCLLFGINFAFFWGFLAFVLNYIPNIGSVSATIPPFLMSFIQYDTLQMPIIFLLILISIQVLIGNIIEPIIMGDRLKLNSLTVIFGLVFWGYIWGIPGMVVSIPLLVLLKLIFEHFPSTSIIARIMGSPD